MMDLDLHTIFISILLLSLVSIIANVLNWVWFRPKKLEKILREQGLNGNPYRLLLGDVKELTSVAKVEQSKSIDLSDDLPPHTLHYFYHINHKCGKNSFIWFGTTPRLNISDPELMKEILMNPSVFQKPHPDPIGEAIVGGITFLEGEEWAKRRKILNPAFLIEKLKGMVPSMLVSCSNMIESLETLVSNSGNSREIDVWPYLEDLTGDIISRTAFGTSFEKGKLIYELQKEQTKLVLQLLQFSFIPGWRYLPTKANRRMRSNSREIKSLVCSIIDERENGLERRETINGDDLLGILLKSYFEAVEKHGTKSANTLRMSIEDVIEECKQFYFAGTETTSNLLAWTLVLLSKHQEWQARAREEVLQAFGKAKPTFDCLNRLKIMTMILQEALRLYPPVPLIVRAPTKRVKLGSMSLPIGVELSLLIGLLHHDPSVWGDDAKEFKPERFGEGVLCATKNQCSFVPFSSGPRICIGQNFAMIGAKMALAMILQRFSFELSPSYKHAPFLIMTLQPQHGVSLILNKL